MSHLKTVSAHSHEVKQKRSFFFSVFFTLQGHIFPKMESYKNGCLCEKMLQIQFGLKKCSETQPSKRYSDDKDFVDLLNCY